MSNQSIANSVCRSTLRGLLVGAIVFIGAMQAAAKQVCKPALAIKDIRFSEMQPPMLERRWSATVSVDASRCAMNSGGYFEIGFSRIKENSTELEFREEFIWLPPSVKVSVDFAADEAVEHSWIDKVTPCPCRE